MGHAGVEFFFVLSGFLIYAIHAADLGRPARAGRFYAKRIVRIFPLYWLVLAGLIGSQIVLLGRIEQRADEPSVLIADALLIPTADGNVLTAAWTLSHELAFYLVFGLMIVRVSSGRLVFVAWQFACLGALAWQHTIGQPMQFPFSFLLSAYNLLFGLGILAARIQPRLSLRMAWLAALGGIVAFAIGGIMDVRHTLSVQDDLVLIYGISAAVAIAGLTRLEALGKLRPPTWLTFLGDASYSIYLVHAPVMAAGAMVFNRLSIGMQLGATTILAILILLGVGAGVLTHLSFERPFLKLSGRWFSRRPVPISNERGTESSVRRQ